jgi:DNA repair protein RecO (recombination protein O)
MDRVTHALVLREVNYKESDKILTILTPEWGKMTVSARGCRKKNSKLGAGAQLLVYSELTLYEYRGRWAVREASPEALFWGVRQDVEKLALASYFAEVMEVCTQEEVEAGELLSLILNALYALDRLNKPQNQVKSVFELKLMSLSGYEPMLDCCAVCGEEPLEPMLHLREGALHCRACREKLGEGVSMPLSPGSLAALRHVVLGSPKRLFSFALPPEEQRRMDDACEAFLLTQLERGFYTLDFYKKLLHMAGDAAAK